MVEINSLLDTFDGSKEDMERGEYIDYISDINLPELPWETQEKLTEIYNKLIRDINNLEIELGKEKISREEIPTTDGLKNEIERLRVYRTKLQNLILKRELNDTAQIEEVINKLVNIRMLDLRPSIALEKYTTMALNIINDAKDIKEKYIQAGKTIDLGVMFIPSESLMQLIDSIEDLRKTIFRDSRVLVMGPNSLAAYLISIHMAFRNIALNERAEEILVEFGNLKKE